MNNKDWNKTTNRFVAFFDIMGFKDMVQRKSHADILKTLEYLKKILKYMEEQNSDNNKVLKERNIEKLQTRSITFSDSIILFSKGDTVKDFEKIMIDSYTIIQKAIENGIGIKGALSYGEITVDFDNYLFFGQPIIDAYLLHDELLLYTAILDNNIEAKLNKIGTHSISKDTIVDYKTPLKSGKITHKLLKTNNDKIPETITNLEKIYESVSGRPRLYIDNTIAFLKEFKVDE